MSEQELSNPNIAVKTLKNTCKSPQTSTKYYSVTMRFGQKLTWAHTKSDCRGFRITSGVPLVSSVSSGGPEVRNTASGGCIRTCWYFLK